MYARLTDFGLFGEYYLLLVLSYAASFEAGLPFLFEFIKVSWLVYLSLLLTSCHSCVRSKDFIGLAM